MPYKEFFQKIMQFESLWDSMTSSPAQIIMLTVLGLLLVWLLRRLLKRRPFPKKFEASVQFVCDGDSVWVKRNGGGRVKLRLAGMDAPETEQAFGRESAECLARLIAGKRVRVTAVSSDEYGRWVSFVAVGRTDVGLEMIRLGCAWAYGRYFYLLSPENRRLYASAQAEAQRTRRGLWQDPEPEAPWQWRERHRSLWQKFLRWLKRLFRKLLR